MLALYTVTGKRRIRSLWVASQLILLFILVLFISPRFERNQDVSVPTFDSRMLFVSTMKPTVEGIGASLNDRSKAMILAKAMGRKFLMPLEYSEHGYNLSLVADNWENVSVMKENKCCHLSDLTNRISIKRIADWYCFGSGSAIPLIRLLKKAKQCQVIIDGGSITPRSSEFNGCILHTMRKIFSEWFTSCSTKSSWKSKCKKIVYHRRAGDIGTGTCIENDRRVVPITEAANVLKVIKQEEECIELKVISLDKNISIYDGLGESFEFINDENMETTFCAVHEADYIILGRSQYGTILAEMARKAVIYVDESYSSVYHSFRVRGRDVKLFRMPKTRKEVKCPLDSYWRRVKATDSSAYRAEDRQDFFTTKAWRHFRCKNPIGETKTEQLLRRHKYM